MVWNKNIFFSLTKKNVTSLCDIKMLSSNFISRFEFQNIYIKRNNMISQLLSVSAVVLCIYRTHEHNVSVMVVYTI